MKFLSGDPGAINSLAAVLISPGKPLELRHIPVPKLGPRNVLIKTSVTGICGTDVHYWKGDFPLTYPVILGHESIGRISEIGDEIKTDSVGNQVRKGDRVFWVNSIPCGKCYYCAVEKDPTACMNRRAYGNLWCCNEFPYLVGGYSEYVYLTEDVSFVKLPESLEEREAIAFGCGGPCIIKAVEYVGGIRQGDKVVVQGSGPVGLYAILLAKLSGASEIISIGGPSHRLQVARKLGATRTIDIFEKRDPAERLKQVLEVTEGRGADFCVEATGFVDAFSEGIEMTRMDGTYLIVGLYSSVGTRPFDPSKIVRKNMRIVGSKFWEPRHLYKMMHTVNQMKNELRIGDIVSHTFDLPHATDAIKAMEKAETLKAIIKP